MRRTFTATMFKEADRSLSNCAAESDSGQSAVKILFGAPKKRIRDYMKDSNPGAGPNADSCDCNIGE